MNKIVYSFVFLAALIFSSCSDSDDGYQDLKNTVKFSEKKLTFDMEGSSKPLSITTNKAWTLACDADWCSFSAKSGAAGITTITVTAEDLPAGSYENREATLTINAEGLTGGNTFKIVQSRYPFFQFDGDTIQLTNAAQYFTVKGKYNYDFKIQKSSWISEVDPITGRAAMTDSTFKFKVGINIHESRTGSIKISNYANTASATIYVKQAGDFAITWKNIGTGSFYDGYFSLTGNKYAVAIQQAEEASNYYKVVDPYTDYLATEGAGLAEYGFGISTPSSEIILWVNEDNTVGFDNFATGIVHPGLGPIWAYSPALFTSGNVKLCKKDGNLISLAPFTYFPAAGGSTGQGDWAETPIEIELPSED